MNRIILMIVFLFISFSPTLVASHFPTSKLAKPIAIPFTMKGDLMIVELKLEGFIPLNLIFDTGAEFSLLFKKPVIDLMKIKYNREVKVLGADRSQIMIAYPIEDLNFRIAQADISMDFLLLKEDYFDVESYVGFRVDGLLGANFFKSFLVEINNKRRIIILHPKENTKELIPDDYTEVSINLQKDRMFIPCSIEMTNGTISQTNLLLDSGAATSLLLFLNTDSSLYNLTEHISPTKIGMGLGGYLNGFSARINQFSIDQYSFSDLTIHYQETDSLYLESNFSRRNGLIGNKILKRFDYFLDYKEEKIYLRPNKKFNEKIRFDKSGLIIFASGPYLNHYFIAFIQEGTPSMESNLQIGDEILSINGRPRFMLSIDKIYKILSGKSGKAIKMKIRRDGKKSKAEFYLKK